MLTLVIGGARSGKTRCAQSLCPCEGRVTYIATARAEDDEMRLRIERHRSDRPPAWTTIEAPLELAAAIRGASRTAEVVLVDCLTVWLGNLCWERRAQPAAEIEREACREIEEIGAITGAGRVILVSNEVGGGIVPENPLARSFRDLQGFVNQRAAALAGEVFLTVAGLPLRIKPQPESYSR